MIMDCIFRDKDICLAVGETIENVKKTRGGGCIYDKKRIDRVLSNL